jgi:hypothetical protein
MVDIHYINSTSFCSLLKEVEDKFLGSDCGSGDGFIILVATIKVIKLRGPKTLIKVRNIMRRK